MYCRNGHGNVLLTFQMKNKLLMERKSEASDQTNCMGQDDDSTMEGNSFLYGELSKQKQRSSKLISFLISRSEIEILAHCRPDCISILRLRF